MSSIENFKFISWNEFGEIVDDSVNTPPTISIGEYAIKNGYNVKNRLSSAVKELLTLAKIYNIKYKNAASPVKFSNDILDAIFTTIIVSAAERDLILKGQSKNATKQEKDKANLLIDQLRLPANVL